MGSRVEMLESEVRELTQDEFSIYRDWFVKFDADEWGRQIESDIHFGKLNKMTAKALSDQIT